jgi:hypothetical protein
MRSSPPGSAPPAKQPDRWHTGWIVLPSDPPLAHRPNPDDPAAFMCRLTMPPGHDLLPARPAGINECGRCAVAIGRARKKVRTAEARRDPLRYLRRPADPEQVDRIDRARQRGTSVRTVTGGLPTLGKRH